MATTTDINAALDEVARGNREAFRGIVETFKLPLRGYLASLVYSAADVDDLAQEVFVTAFRSLASYRRGTDFGAWLRGIARNKVAHHFRSRTRRDAALDRFRDDVAQVIEGDLEAEAATWHRERIEALLRCIARLPDRLRQVVRSGLDGIKPATLAAELRTTTGAVYNLHYRANQLLRDCVAREVG